MPATYSAGTDSGTLLFTSSTKRPVRNAVVQIRQCTTVLAEVTTNDAGQYTVDFTPGAQGSISVVALAKTNAPPIQVQDNTDGDAIWAVSKVIDYLEPDPRPLRDPRLERVELRRRRSQRRALRHPRLDVHRRDRVHRRPRPAAALFPALSVNWSPNNVPSQTFDARTASSTPRTSRPRRTSSTSSARTATTPTSTTRTSSSTSGRTTSRRTSRAATAPAGGTARATSSTRASRSARRAAPRWPRCCSATRSTRTPAGGTATASTRSASTPRRAEPDRRLRRRRHRLNPGPFSEMSIIRALYDLWDSGTNEAWDTTSIPLGTIYDVLVGPERTTPALHHDRLVHRRPEGPAGHEHGGDRRRARPLLHRGDRQRVGLRRR